MVIMFPFRYLQVRVAASFWATFTGCFERCSELQLQRQLDWTGTDGSNNRSR
jgi:hypothetical protein